MVSESVRDQPEMTLIFHLSPGLTAQMFVSPAGARTSGSDLIEGRFTERLVVLPLVQS